NIQELIGLQSKRSQFSQIRPSTRANPRSLSVTRTWPSASAWAAISRSFAPIGLPLCSRRARSKPYVLSAGGSKGKTSRALRTVASCLVSRGPDCGEQDPHSGSAETPNRADELARRLTFKSTMHLDALDNVPHSRLVSSLCSVAVDVGGL